MLGYDQNLADYIECTDKMGHENVLKETAKSHLLLLLSDTKLINLSAKVFDYLRLKRGIMLVKDDRSVLSNILDECKAGIKCNTPIEVCKSLKKLYDQFESGDSFENETVNYSKYSRKYQSEKMIQLLKERMEGQC